ncbi:hypothetical protein [Olivibacter jilunii]|uniref:hypothetical protein n=1 Tax=Olivibacter jilunii TaxID=985016 RepID=UPI003F171B53
MKEKGADHIIPQRLPADRLASQNYSGKIGSISEIFTDMRITPFGNLHSRKTLNNLLGIGRTQVDETGSFTKEHLPNEHVFISTGTFLNVMSG